MADTALDDEFGADATVVRLDVSTDDGTAQLGEVLDDHGALHHVVTSVGSWWSGGMTLDASELRCAAARFNEVRIATRVEREPRPGVVASRDAGDFLRRRHGRRPPERDHPLRGLTRGPGGHRVVAHHAPRTVHDHGARGRGVTRGRVRVEGRKSWSG